MVCLIGCSCFRLKCFGLFDCCWVFGVAGTVDLLGMLALLYWILRFCGYFRLEVCVFVI